MAYIKQQNNNTASTNQSLSSGCSVVIARKYKINSGIKLTIYTGAILRIL